MTETYVAGFSEAFRIIPKYPGFAVSSSGRVFDLNTHRMVVVNEDGFAEIIREEASDRIRIVELDVQYWVDQLFGKD